MFVVMAMFSYGGHVSVVIFQISVCQERNSQMLERPNDKMTFSLTNVNAVASIARKFIQKHGIEIS